MAEQSIEEKIVQLKEDLEESERHNKYTIEESDRAIKALREGPDGYGENTYASWRERIWWLETQKLIIKHQKALKWIAERGWNPHGTVSENSMLSYDCHCVAAGALSKNDSNQN
jgi:hypothetical protein